MSNNPPSKSVSPLSSAALDMCDWVRLERELACCLVANQGQIGFDINRYDSLWHLVQRNAQLQRDDILLQMTRSDSRFFRWFGKAQLLSHSRNVIIGTQVATLIAFIIYQGFTTANSSVVVLLLSAFISINLSRNIFRAAEKRI